MKKNSDDDFSMTSGMEELFDVDELCKEANLSVFQVAMIKRLKKWLPKKKVTKEEFASAIQELKRRKLL